MKLSVIIPVLGDAVALNNLLATLRNMPDPANELIVVDGSADGQCRQAAASHGAVYLQSAPGRGGQLALGAAQAGGAILWFLHADAEPPAAGPAAIRQAAAAGSVGGWFRFRFSGPPGWHKLWLARLSNWRCRIGTPYGDQGLFMLAEAYRQAGGFPDQPLFEEVELVRGLRRLGRFQALPLSIGVSPRRWEQDGWLTRSLANRLLAVGYMLGISPGTLARHYRPIHHDPGARKC